jgi:hypothetical protein
MAIEVSELKINNFVSSKCHNGLITQIHTVMPANVRLWANPIAIYEHSDLDSVTLTDEILLKCGFKFNGYRSYYVLIFDSLFLELLKRNNGSFQPRNCTSDTGIEIKSLHQLQNLYFSLTGKELNVNL